MEPKKQIQEYIEAGELFLAKELVKKYEVDLCEDLEFISMKAVIAIMDNEYEEAKKLLLLGLEQKPTDFDLLYNLAYVYRVMNEKGEAFQCYDTAFKATDSNEKKSLIIQELQALKKEMEGSKRKSLEKPLVSIVVLAYNKLEYTRLCVQSILKYTSHINYELILVNNGSTDETQEFFDSIPNARVIHLKENVGPVNGFNEGIYAAKGIYTAAVCNDFIFTPRWLDNLLICIESDESIGYVSPGASNISNHQSIRGTYSNIEEMLEFAEGYNHSDPRKWEERVRLLPCVLMVRTFLLQELGGFDPQFYFGEFADDDISFRIRRRGYKLIYCKDTFTFHFGSVTTGENQINNNSLEVSRKIFVDKFNIDSWSEALFNPVMTMSLINHPLGQAARILGINTKCGGNPLQLKNYLKEDGLNDILITNYCLDEKYLVDLNTVSNRVVSGSLNEIQQQLKEDKYNYIILEHDGNVFEVLPNLFNQLNDLLDEKGFIALNLQITEKDEHFMKSMTSLISDHGFTITLQQFYLNALNGYDLTIVGRKGV